MNVSDWFVYHSNSCYPVCTRGYLMVACGHWPGWFWEGAACVYLSKFAAAGRLGGWVMARCFTLVASKASFTGFLLGWSRLVFQGRSFRHWGPDEEDGEGWCDFSRIFGALETLGLYWIPKVCVVQFHRTGSVRYHPSLSVLKPRPWPKNSLTPSSPYYGMVGKFREYRRAGAILRLLHRVLRPVSVSCAVSTAAVSPRLGLARPRGLVLPRNSSEDQNNRPGVVSGPRVSHGYITPQDVPGKSCRSIPPCNPRTRQPTDHKHLAGPRDNVLTHFSRTAQPCPIILLQQRHGHCMHS